MGVAIKAKGQQGVKRGGERRGGAWEVGQHEKEEERGSESFAVLCCKGKWVCFLTVAIFCALLLETVKCCCVLCVRGWCLLPSYDVESEENVLRLVTIICVCVMSYRCVSVFSIVI